jgi:hypothetical protein
VNPTAGQRDLAGVVPQVTASPHERNLPATISFVQNEDNGRPAGAPPELTPAVDRMEQVFEAIEEISQNRLLVNSAEAGKLGKVAESR